MVAAVNLTGQEAVAGEIGCCFPPVAINEEEEGVNML